MKSHLRWWIILFLFYSLLSPFFSQYLSSYLPSQFSSILDISPTTAEGTGRFIIVVAVIATIFLTQRALIRTGKRLKDRTLRLVQEHPARVFFSIVALLVFIYFSPSLPTVSSMFKLWPIGRTLADHIIAVVSIAGVIFSALGFLYTYLQLRDTNDRIVGYGEFYRWVRTLFKEIEDGKANEFYFYGPTILPGNVALGDADPDVRNFKEELDNLYRKRVRFDKAGRCVIITPPLDKYEEIYLPYMDTCMSHAPKQQTKEDWTKYVKAKQEEASNFQRDLPANFGKKLIPKEMREIATAYFLSNGKRIIYVKPLHYVSARNSGDDQRQSPHLVGFTATDSVTIDAFQDHFEKLGLDPDKLDDDPNINLDRERLQRMYSKHLVTPGYLNERIKELHPLSVETLAAYDHDHFGGKITTEKFLTRFNIKPGDRILDIGSGFGGPARYIAEKRKCFVHGIELQADRFKWAKEMTERLNLSKQVDFSEIDACGAVDQLLPDYDYALAFLSILHFSNKSEFLKRLGSRIKVGGTAYIEDYVFDRKVELSDGEKNDLAEFLACPSLLTSEMYASCLTEGGLRIIETENTTVEWKLIAKQRAEDFENERDDYRTRGEKDIFENAQAFNRKVVQLYDAGVIEGRRIIAEKM